MLQWYFQRQEGAAPGAQDWYCNGCKGAAAADAADGDSGKVSGSHDTLKRRALQHLSKCPNFEGNQAQMGVFLRVFQKWRSRK